MDFPKFFVLTIYIYLIVTSVNCNEEDSQKKVTVEDVIANQVELKNQIREISSLKNKILGIDGNSI